MGFFDKLSNFASDVCAHQAKRYENAANFGRVGDHRLSESQRQMARDKAAELRDASYRLHRDED